jgi:tRNA 2-thiouridine synthesizing protein A
MGMAQVTQTLDVRGQACPLPIVRASQAIKTLDAGQTLEVLATDRGALSDFPAWSKTTGNELIEQTTEDNGVYRFVLRKS